MKKSHAGGQRNESGRMPQRYVGIFWRLHGKLLTDSTRLSEAETHLHFKIHSGDHISVWAKFQRNGIVPSEMEYEEAPRGRVMFDTKKRQFTMLADRCILRDKGVLRKIMSVMSLPSKNTDKGTDSHYRCFACLRAQSE
jgi:hypothetical protein